MNIQTIGALHCEVNQKKADDYLDKKWWQEAVRPVMIQGKGSQSQ